MFMVLAALRTLIDEAFLLLQTLVGDAGGGSRPAGVQPPEGMLDEGLRLRDVEGVLR